MVHLAEPRKPDPVPADEGILPAASRSAPTPTRPEATSTFIVGWLPMDLKWWLQPAAGNSAPPLLPEWNPDQ